MTFGTRCRWCKGLMLYVTRLSKKGIELYHCPICDVGFPTGVDARAVQGDA